MPEQIEQLKNEIAQLEAETGATVPVQPTAPVGDVQFTRAQQRLINNLSVGWRKTGVDPLRDVNPDRLVVAQITLLMLERDGNDGILYAAQGWHSGSDQSLADRMKDHKTNHECKPEYRFSMQTPERQVQYAKQQCALLGIPYVEPKPEIPLRETCKLTSAEFAAYVCRFHHKLLQWELKEFIYTNLKTPGKQFFAGFLALQKDFDKNEETIYKGAYSAHMRATDPALGEDEAADFLEFLEFMADMTAREDERIALRIASTAPVPSEPIASTVPVPETSQPAFTMDDMLNYQAWKLTRDGKPAGIADWIKEKQAA